MKFCSEVFECVLVMVRNKKSAQNRNSVVGYMYLLLGIEEIFISLDEHGGSKASQGKRPFFFKIVHAP